MQNTTQGSPLIKVTDRAVNAIRECMADEGKSVGESYLRVAVKGGGCSGLMYELAIVDDQGEEDTVVAYGDVRIVVDKKSKLFLLGLTLDYTSGLNGKGFVFSNPNATGTCGCGESFTV
jgi:iron-sulfur cluster assembly protein